jgi:DNA polymerase-3 subunit epsilon
MSADGSALSSSLAGLDHVITWQARPTPDHLAKLPGGPAVILFVDESDRPVQLLAPQQARRIATTRLLNAEEPTPGRADLAAVVRGVRWRETHSGFETRWGYYRAARELYAKEYRKMVTFGPASFLCFDEARSVGEIRVSDRIWSATGAFVGPWPTQRAAREALEGLWDLFDLCRYPEQARRMPVGRRCAYYDMGRCDAPCDGTAAPEPYARRVRDAWRFVLDGPAEWLAAAEERMRSAATSQAFEQAAVIKGQIKFARRWLGEWAGALLADREMNRLLLIPATRRKAWTPFLFLRGELLGGPLIPARHMPTQAVEWLQARLCDEVQESPAVIRMEQSWLVAQFLRRRECADAIVVCLGAAPKTHAASREALRGVIEAELSQRMQRSETPPAPDSLDR